MPERVTTSRPSRRRRAGRWAVVACAALVAAAGVATFGLAASPPAAAPEIAPPWEYTAPAWQDELGGDTAPTSATYEALNRARSGLTAGDAAALRELAAAVEVADLTGAGRGSYPALWPPPAQSGVSAPARCSQVQVLATSPAPLPTVTDGPGRYAKVLVAVSGTCTAGEYTAASPLVEFTYAEHTDQGWQPVRDWRIPARPDTPAAAGAAANEPASWQLKAFTCGSPDVVMRDRILVVDAFDRMCAAAAADGVKLRVTSAYRTRAEQAALFATAVKQYGGRQAAARWVAYADAATCQSRHCSGLAVNVAPDGKAMAWLTATVGCLGGGAVTMAVTCPEGAAALPRMARYGFSAPLPQIDGYLEFTAPAGQLGAAGSLAPADCNPQGVAVPSQVASIFRCRLAREGIYGAAQDDVVAGALVVSRCESDWNAQARAFGGKFTTDPNPKDGRTYTQAGVFMVEAATADAGWVVGGSAALTDPVANINGAASLWLATRSFDQFGCATGTDDGFETGPVLPGWGGPALPNWSRQY